LAYDLKVPFTTWHIAEWSNPQRGDIVVFYSPHDEKRLVKRVIGLPGDSIELRNDVLIINEKTVEYAAIATELLRDMASADRASHVFATEQLPARTHAVAGYPGVRALRDSVPSKFPGSIFYDGRQSRRQFRSRYWGAVERKRIIGKATAVVMSTDREHYWKPRWDRFFTSLSREL